MGGNACPNTLHNILDVNHLSGLCSGSGDSCPEVDPSGDMIWPASITSLMDPELPCYPVFIDCVVLSVRTLVKSLSHTVGFDFLTGSFVEDHIVSDWIRTVF